VWIQEERDGKHLISFFKLMSLNPEFTPDINIKHKTIKIE